MDFDFLNSAMPAAYQPVEVIINILVALVVGLLIATVYQKTHKGLSYSQGFVFALVLLVMITSVVMMVIGNNVAKAFTLVGALSIIRFRTAVKDHRDIAFIFMALVSGMACGTTNYFIVVVATSIILGAAWALTALNFGSITRHEYIVRFLFRSGEQSDDAYKEVLESFVRSSVLLGLNSIEDGKMLELSYNVRLKDASVLNEFVKRLGAVTGVDNVQVISAKHDVDY
jgi:uncharacterized membrane protein YhiD involved in acid resistance